MCKKGRVVYFGSQNYYDFQVVKEFTNTKLMCRVIKSRTKGNEFFSTQKEDLCICAA